MTNLDGYDWSVVGYPCNQLPGSPEVVAQTASGFRNTANQLSLAARSLRRLDNTSDTCSEAVDKIVGKANEVAGLLDQVYARYATSAGALSAYAPALAHAQDQAEQALRGAAQAKHDHDIAQRNAVQAYDHARAGTDPLERQELLQHYYSQKSRAESSASSVDNARAIIAGAIHARDLAAKKAAGQIDGAVHDSQLNDRLTDHLKEVWHDVEDLASWVYEHDPVLRALVDSIAALAKWVWDNIDTIALVLTIVAFAVSWVPGLNVVVAVLAAAARVAVVASKVKSAVSMGESMLTAVRTGDWGPVVTSGGVLLLSAGLGRVGGKLLKSAEKRTVGVLQQRAGQYLDDVGNRARQDLMKVSLRQKGEEVTLARSILEHRGTPVYHPGHDARAMLSQQGREIDSMLATFKGSDYTDQVKSLSHTAINAADPRVRKLANDAISMGVHDGKKFVEDQVKAALDRSGGPHNSSSAYHRSTQVCPAGSGAW